jgi:Mce-associated membrane protein
VEVAAGGTGDRPVTPGAEPRARRHTSLNLALYVLALLLACACVFGGVLVVQEHGDRARAAVEQERYGDVLAAARAEVEAFINIDYQRAQESIDAVAAGATGDFAEQYDTSTKSVIEVLERNKSVMDGTVLWAGVVSVDSDSATVIAATTGTVANVSTDNEPVARYFRLKLDLRRVDGDWLTANLEFVG